MWPYIFYSIVESNIIDAQTFTLHMKVEAGDDWSTSRDLIGFVLNERFKEVNQLLKFGYIVNKDYMDNNVKYFNASSFLSFLS